MRYPEFLKDNGTIGFVAPSFGCNIEPYKSGFDHAQKKFADLGYRMKLGPNCYKGEGIGISNTPAACAQELMEAYVDEESDCLISCGGGELMCETISLVDFEKMKNAKPKWYMGYSDNTNMTYLLATLCDTASIYGPCAASFCMEKWHKSLQDALDLLTGRTDSVKGYEKWEKESLKSEENPFAEYNLTEKKTLKVFEGYRELTDSKREAEKTKIIDKTEDRMTAKIGNAEENGVTEETRMGKKLEFSGRLIGGCMDCLVNLLGTRFDRTKEFLEKYKEDGFIWFLEACDLNVFSIRRAMWQMEEAGWFQYVKGFLIGRPLCFGQTMMGLDAYDAVLHIAGTKDVPIVMDVDLGHLPPMMPLIVGSCAQVKVDGDEISIQMKK